MATLATIQAAAESNDGKLYFEPDKIETSNGSEFVTELYVDTAGYDSAGVGAILRYNPIFLEAVRIEPGIVFDDYPLAVIDNTEGKVTISGVSGSKNDLYNGRGVFASVTWRPKKTGLSEISFEFELGSTTDSNIAVTFGNGDILGSVNTFNATVLAGGGSIMQASPKPTAPPASGTIIDQGLDKLSSVLGKNPEGDIDPYAPIVRREPITDLSPTAGEAKLVSQRSGPPTALIVLVVVVIVLVLALVIFVARKIKNRHATTVVVQNFDPKAPQPPVPPANY